MVLLGQGSGELDAIEAEGACGLAGEAVGEEVEWFLGVVRVFEIGGDGEDEDGQDVS